MKTIYTQYNEKYLVYKTFNKLTFYECEGIKRKKTLEMCDEIIYFSTITLLAFAAINNFKKLRESFKTGSVEQCCVLKTKIINSCCSITLS